MTVIAPVFIGFALMPFFASIRVIRSCNFASMPVMRVRSDLLAPT